MKAVQINEFGGADAMRYQDVADPAPGSGEAVVEIQAAGVNFTDIYSRAGINPGPPLPRTIGVEGAGVVKSVGEGVTEVAVGDEVVYCSVNGSYAEQALVPSWRLIKRPSGVDAKAGAAAMLQGMTAHYLCHSTYPVQKGDAVIVHAGAGGMGLVLTQMIKNLGGYVFTTVSTDEKAELSRQAGADHVINYTEQDFAEEVKKATGGDGVRVVYDGVGKTTFHQSVSCLGRRGVMALYGGASGNPDPIDPRLFAAGSLYLTRPGLGDYTVDRAELESRAGDVLGWVASGQLKLRIGHEFALSDAPEAHRQLESRATTGKVLLIP
jgi:NADPH2:quinone reductase